MQNNVFKLEVKLQIKGKLNHHIQKQDQHLFCSKHMYPSRTQYHVYAFLFLYVTAYLLHFLVCMHSHMCE